GPTPRWSWRRRRLEAGRDGDGAKTNGEEGREDGAAPAPAPASGEIGRRTRRGALRAPDRTARPGRAAPDLSGEEEGGAPGTPCGGVGPGSSPPAPATGSAPRGGKRKGSALVPPGLGGVRSR